MKLISYKVSNFRSILDSREIDLSNDNINVLIWQNESWKSSLLESLEMTQSWKINENDIRADNTKPIIMCKYKFDNIEEFEKYVNDEWYILDNKIKEEIIKNDNTLSLDYIFEWTKFDKIKFTDESFISFLESLYEELEEKEDISAQEIEIKKEDGTIETKVKKDNYIKDVSDIVNIIHDMAPDILLFKDNSLLPAKINLSDIKDEKSKVIWKIWVNNFLKLTGLTIPQLERYEEETRLISTQIDKACKELSDDFWKFWSQNLWKKDKISIKMEINNHWPNSDTPWEPYLSFWIIDKNWYNTPEQRSKWVRWYISFFLQMKYYSKNFEEIPRIILIDEPWANLHAKAQKDILKIFEYASKSFQIIYATHSPFLIDTDKIYRVLAAERIEEESWESNTQVFNFHKLWSASEDTLTPLYTHMWISLWHQEVIKEKNNIILEEISAYFYIKWILLLFNYNKDVYFLPATWANNIPKLCNLLLWWWIDFWVLLDDDSKWREVLKEINNNMVIEEWKAIKIKWCDWVEDLFSKKDFQKFILEKKVDFWETKISKYLSANKNISKVILAKNFYIKVDKWEITKTDLSSWTLSSFVKLIWYVDGILEK